MWTAVSRPPRAQTRLASLDTAYDFCLTRPKVSTNGSRDGKCTFDRRNISPLDCVYENILQIQWGSFLKKINMCVIITKHVFRTWMTFVTMLFYISNSSIVSMQQVSEDLFEGKSLMMQRCLRSRRNQLIVNFIVFRISYFHKRRLTHLNN